MRLPAPYVAEVLVLYTIKTQTRGCPLLDSLVTFSLHCNFVYAGSKSCGHRCGNIVFESRASLVKLKFRSLCAQGSVLWALQANNDELQRTKLASHGLTLTARSSASACSLPADTPSAALKEDDIPDAWSIQAINKWITAFDEATQASALDIIRILQKSACTQDQLKEALPDMAFRWPS